MALFKNYKATITSHTGKVLGTHEFKDINLRNAKDFAEELADGYDFVGRIQVEQI